MFVSKKKERRSSRGHLAQQFTWPARDFPPLHSLSLPWQPLGPAQLAQRLQPRGSPQLPFLFSALAGRWGPLPRLRCPLPFSPSSFLPRACRVEHELAVVTPPISFPLYPLSLALQRPPHPVYLT